MKNEEFQITERPDAGPRSNANVVTAAIIKTAEDGTAVRVPLNGTSVHVLRNRYSHGVARAGLLLRTKQDGDAMLFWAVERAK